MRDRGCTTASQYASAFLSRSGCNLGPLATRALVLQTECVCRSVWVGGQVGYLVNVMVDLRDQDVEGVLLQGLQHLRIDRGRGEGSLRLAEQLLEGGDGLWAHLGRGEW